MDEFAPDLMSLLDEEGNEFNFEILDRLEDNGIEYIALLPIFDSPDEMLQENSEFVIMKTEEVDGEELLAPIGDEDPEFERLAELFEKRIEEMLEKEDEEDEDLQ